MHQLTRQRTKAIQRPVTSEGQVRARQGRAGQGRIERGEERLMEKGYAGCGRDVAGDAQYTQYSIDIVRSVSQQKENSCSWYSYQIILCFVLFLFYFYFLFYSLPCCPAAFDCNDNICMFRMLCMLAFSSSRASPRLTVRSQFAFFLLTYVNITQALLMYIGHTYNIIYSISQVPWCGVGCFSVPRVCLNAPSMLCAEKTHKRLPGSNS